LVDLTLQRRSSGLSFLRKQESRARVRTSNCCLFRCEDRIRPSAEPLKATNRQSGFSLLELVITFTILSLLLLAIAGTLRLGSTAWEKGEEKSETYQKSRAAFSLLSQQLKSAYPYKVKAKQAEPDYLAFQGEGDSLRFVTTFSLKSKRPEGLVFVTYKIEEGKSSDKILKVCEQRVVNKDFMEDSPKDDDFITFMDGLSGITFEYYRESDEDETEGEWVKAWDGKDEDELPRQIRVNLTWKEKKGESEIVLPAVVSIPAYLYDDKGKPTTTRATQKPGLFQPRQR
jgi:general secretion pathway protein J